MAFLNDLIYGPVHSRRLGISLGVNLMPSMCKLCNFECIYCECGWSGSGAKPPFHSRSEVSEALANKLTAMAAEGVCPDVITFAGNGEPTTHPQFEQIIDDTLSLRDRLAQSAKVSVLSNATMIDRASVRKALLKVDNNILKLDSAFDSTVRLINNPRGNYSVAHTVGQMMLFEGRLTIQTMLLRGTFNGERVDNTTQEQTDEWLKLIGQIKPRSVMLYTIDRQTPAPDLEKVSTDDMNRVADRVRALGIECSVAG